MLHRVGHVALAMLRWLRSVAFGCVRLRWLLRVRTAAEYSGMQNRAPNRMPLCMVRRKDRAFTHNGSLASSVSVPWQREVALSGHSCDGVQK